MNCQICGDPGFSDCLFICNQCNEVAEHVYCMLRPPESDEEASWSCEECRVKQKIISEKMVISSLNPQVQQSPERITKRQRESADSCPVNKKQIIEISKGMDSYPFNKKQIMEISKGMDSYPFSKKRSIEISKGMDSYPFSKKRIIKISKGMDSYPFSKKQACSNSKCEPPVQTDSPATALMPARDYSYGVSQEMHSCLQSDVPSRIAEARKFESSDTITSPFYSKFLLHLPKNTSVNRLGSKQSPSPTAQTSPDRLSAGSKSSDVKQPPARVMSQSVGADSYQVNKRQNLDNSKVMNSLQFGSKQSLANSKCESPIQIDSPIAAIEPPRAKGYGGSQEMGSSLPSHVPSRIPKAGKLECPPICTSSLSDLPKKTSLNRMGSKQSTAQTSSYLLSAGSKSNVSGKSSPDALPLAQRVLKGSERIRSGQSLLHRKSSDPIIAVDCKKQLIELASCGDMENKESTKDSPKLKKSVGRHKVFEEPEALSSWEVHEEDCRGLTPKGNSSGPSRQSDMNSSNKVPSTTLVCKSNQPTPRCLSVAIVPSFTEIDPKWSNTVLPNPIRDYCVNSAGATNNCKEIDQTQCVKSTFEYVNERELETIDRGVEWKSNKYMDKRKLQNQGNATASKSMNNRPLSASERGDVAGSLLSDVNNSNGAAPHQKMLNLPQSQILWKGSFNVVGDVCGNLKYDGGIHAHPSQTASPKVIEVTKQLSSQLQLEQVHCAEAWPKRFQESLPTDESIGLYFFPADRKRNESYAKLVEIMVNFDLAMRMHFNGVELLMYSSIKLPNYVQSELSNTIGFDGRFYIWGVFRGPERGATCRRVQGASSPHNHMGKNNILPNSNTPSTSNIRVSVARGVAIPSVYKNGGGEEDMDVEVEGEHDVVISETPSSRLDFRHVEVSTRYFSQLLVPRDSEVNCIQEGDNVSGCASLKQDSSSIIPHGTRSKASEEIVKKDVFRRTMESIDQSHAWNHPSGNKEELDGQLGFNSSAPHILGGNNSGKSSAAMLERINAHETHQGTHRRELPRRFGSLNSRYILERNDEVPQVVNRTPGSVSLCLTHSKTHPSFSDCSTYKQRHKHFQVTLGSKTVPGKQIDPRDQYFAFSSRKYSCDRNKHDRHHKSDELSLSSGESDSSYQNRLYAFSAPSNYREVHMSEDVNRISRSGSFKEVNCRTRREKDDREGRKEDAKWRIVKACGNITSEALKGQHQQNKDQWSFTPLNKSTTEAEENNVSEVSNAASLLESSEQKYSGENNPFEHVDADDSTTVNSRAGHISGCGLDQFLLANCANCYDGSSSGGADLETVACLELFPLEEESLGMAKEVVNDWDIDLDLGLGRKTLKKMMKQADREAYPNRSNVYRRGDSDTKPFLSLSVPLTNKKV